MGIVLSGKDLTNSLKEQMAIEVVELEKKYGRVPHLAVILVGEDPGSVSYVKGKEKACNEIGIKNTTIKRTSDITEEELLSIVEELNNDDNVDGILVQLPLPKHINTDKVIESVRFDKDVDGFHPMNVANLWLNKKGCMTDFTIPCTPKGIIKLLEEANIAVGGKEVVVIGRSNIVGLPIAKLLLDRNATVTIAHSKTLNLEEVTNRADILIVATGQPRMLKNWMVKEGAVVIDVGVNRDIDGKLCGDVDFDNVQYVASYITKVPGGVGPMTIACLMENTIECFKRNAQKEDHYV